VVAVAPVVLLLKAVAEVVQEVIKQEHYLFLQMLVIVLLLVLVLAQQAQDQTVLFMELLPLEVVQVLTLVWEVMVVAAVVVQVILCLELED
jgi:hypothetical protein